jgi:wobble nucleotide-excising tRNase
VRKGAFVIRNIRIQGVKSFPRDRQLSIPIDHTLRVALFYGNNGAGKSAIGEVIYRNGNGIDPYPNCAVEHTGQDRYHHLVYNEEFVERNFRNTQGFPGIFSIGQVDTDALRETEEKQAEQTTLLERRHEIDRQKEQRAELEEVSLAAATEATWKAYKRHIEGPMAPFLARMGKSKPSVFEKIKSVVLPEGNVAVDLAELHIRMKDVASADPPKDRVSLEIGGTVEEELSPLWQQSIVGSTDSRLAPLIKELGNMDWVSVGTKHIRDDQCPFCQEKLPHDFRDEMNKLIDTSYRDYVAKVNTLASTYERRIREIERDMEAMFSREPFAAENSQLRVRWGKYWLRLTKNLQLMQAKLGAPGDVIEMPDSRPELSEVFRSISDTNTRIDAFNERINHRAQERAQIETDFWKRMRHDYGSAIDVHQATADECTKVVQQLNDERDLINTRLSEITRRLAQIRANSVGTERAVEAINRRLKRHGINDFTIAKKPGEGNLYCLERPEVGQEDYKSLSEGEKTVIAFFYFIELVRGSVDQDNHVSQHKKIVVIDDPISSLSNTFVYDIAWLIANEIIGGDDPVRQVFVLTHSLFFHHELIKQIKGKCQYFRVIKRPHTAVISMGKDDIKNEYDAAWQVIRDAHSGSGTTAGVANAMRCIFEQFFTFTAEKGEFKQALQTMEDADRRFVPLSRYLDNQSHRNDQNLTDFGDYDIQFYLEKFKAVFDATEYPQHYAIRIGVPPMPAAEPAQAPNPGTPES